MNLELAQTTHYSERTPAEEKAVERARDAKEAALEQRIADAMDDLGTVSDAVADLIKEADFHELIARMVMARKKGHAIAAYAVLHQVTFAVCEHVEATVRAGK